MFNPFLSEIMPFISNLSEHAVCWREIGGKIRWAKETDGETMSAYHLNEISVRMFRQMVLHDLYLEKEMGMCCIICQKNELFRLENKPVVPVVSGWKTNETVIFSGTCNCGQTVQKFPGIPVKARKKEYLERYYLFSENIPRE